MKISFYADNSVKQIGLGGDFELIENEDFIIEDFNAIDINGNRKYIYKINLKLKTCESILNSEYKL